MSTIAENLSRIQQAKADIKTAIEAKGVTVPSSATIDTYDDYVSQISGGGGQTYEAELKGLIERSLTSIDIPSGTTTIGNYAFANYATLSSVTIPNSVTSIGSTAFSSCSSLRDITIPSGVTMISNSAFYTCTSLSSVTIPNSVTSIGDFAFASCTHLNTLTIPNSVTTIGASAFNTCGLLTIHIGSGLTSIGNAAFRFDQSLESVFIEAAEPPTLGTSVFANTNNTFIIYVPSESVTAYQTASGWSAYASRIEAIPNS